MSYPEFRMPSGVRIVCAYPGTGKTCLAKESYAFADVDHPELKFEKDMPIYIQLIKQALAIPSMTVLVPSWPVLRNALREEGLQYVLFYPSRDLKFDYNKRYVERGTRKDKVDQLWWNWDVTLESCEQDYTPHKVEMKQSQARLADYFL